MRWQRPRRARRESSQSVSLPSSTQQEQSYRYLLVVAATNVRPKKITGSLAGRLHHVDTLGKIVHAEKDRSAGKPSRSEDLRHELPESGVDGALRHDNSSCHPSDSAAREALLSLTQGVSATKKKRLLALCYCQNEHALRNVVGHQLDLVVENSANTLSKVDEHSKDIAPSQWGSRLQVRLRPSLTKLQSEGTAERWGERWLSPGSELEWLPPRSNIVVISAVCLWVSWCPGLSGGKGCRLTQGIEVAWFGGAWCCGLVRGSAHGVVGCVAMRRPSQGGKRISKWWEWSRPSEMVWP